MPAKVRPNSIASLIMACLVCLSLILAVGCAQKTLQKRSGFLQDYTRLQVDPADPSIMWWADGGVKWKKYKRLMLDPVEVRIDPAKAQRELTRQEIAKLAGDFRKVALKVLNPHYPVVTKPAPDVLRVRVALTHLVPVAPIMNVTSVAMIGLPLDLGEAGIEARFSDSVTGKLLGEMTDFKKGSRLSLDMGWSRWGHVETAFEDWAIEMKKGMDDIHEKKK